MKNTDFLPSAYDGHGRLRLPFVFWCVLLLQARAWVVFVMAGASRQQGGTLLDLFYPDHDNFWIGLLPGVPAVLAFLLSGRRHQLPRLWPLMRWILILAQLVLLFWQPLLWWQGEPLSGMGLALVIVDGFALWWLLSNPRLRACFSLQED
ncbi:DUF2919 domain-containing protein [Scandinavium sp. TWS1a]|uniref:DUF2919 domain-containing protein n=1 Tax=Scandinavium tedordense TaxID=2926521 RepID=UPI0021667726|nr:DUF2919 domain-containing protein [Scandinavium tedordense]MCS2170703.1 DUF2919 domain-containing protein [Scandinavium tedordense]